MKNHNYNLVKMLHNCLDTTWRIDKHYLDDCRDLNCDCRNIMEEIAADNRKHIEKLVTEIKKHDLSQ